LDPIKAWGLQLPLNTPVEGVEMRGHVMRFATSSTKQRAVSHEPALVSQDLYTTGAYHERNPRWHVEESSWKAKYVLRMLNKNRLSPKTICDVGCGAGEVLRLMQQKMEDGCRFWGYEISPQAFALSQRRANERLNFKLGDIRREKDAHFDLILLMDVIEHLEDYFSFLRDLHPKSEYKILHIPLDVSVRTVLFHELIDFRATYGHLHVFTRETAIQMLRDLGYEVVDWLYTWQSDSLRSVWNEHKESPLQLAHKFGGALKRKILGLPSQLCFALHEELAARILGRWRLLVLVK
jgi:SAM-dependent methyltransferase